MSEEHLDAKDRKILLLWILAGLTGAAIAFQYFFVAFPEAAVDFRVSRPEAVARARAFLAAQPAIGERLDGYQSSIVFRVDDTAKTYLERELGLAQANRLMASEADVWYWAVRFFRPLQQEEVHVHVDPAGRIVGMRHIIEEARAGSRLEREAARAVAESFLRGPLQVDLARYDFLAEEANSTERPKRRDWNFTWERRGFKAKDAPYRLRVTVQGDRVGGYGEFLKVPEAWARDFQRLRSSNLFYQWAAQVPFAFLQGAVFLVLFDLGRRGLVRWRGGLKLGLVLAVLFFVMNANEWPLTRAVYDTNSSYTGFFLSQMVLAALGSLGLGLLVALTVAAAEPLYRRSYPDKLRLGVAFRLDGLRSKEFFRSSVIGLAMAAAHIGFVVAFYIVGRRFGFWVPQEIKYTDAVSTALPWIYPLAISLYAATSEEFLFRLFAIPLLLRFTKSKALAIVLPAFVWGFLHSAYPVEPGYARGIEVGVIGIVAGWVMIRWGIVATLVWHYTVDAVQIALFLLRSQSLYFRLSGALVAAAVLIPLAVAGAFLIRRRRFASGEALLNRGEPLPVSVAQVPSPPRAAAPVAYEALDSRTRTMVLAGGALGVLLFATMKVETIGDFVRLDIDARQAATQADAVLRQRQVDPARYRRTATFISTFDSLASEYLRRQVGIAGTNRIYRDKVPSAFWRVRYFRDSQKEEYAVVLRTDGTLHSVHHLLEEKAPGANLTKEEAQARAEAYLREAKQFDLVKSRLVEATSDKRPSRTDHTFVWEELASIGEAHVRAELKVLGDDVTGYRVFVKIPEQWQRRQGEQTLAATAYTVGRIVFFAALAVTILVLFFKNLKQPAVAGVPWRRLARWALWGGLMALVSISNNVPVLLAQYTTEVPFKTFVAVLFMGLFVVLALLYSLVFFLFGLAWFFLARVFGEECLPAWSGMPARYYRDAFWLALGGAGILLGLARLPYLLARVWPTARRSLEASLPNALDTWIPAASPIASAALTGFVLAGIIALAAGFLAGWIRHRWLQFGLLLLTAVALPGIWGSPADFLRRALVQLVFLGIVWWGVTRVFRFNLLAYFLLAATLTLVNAAVGLLRQPNAFYRWNGCAVVAALLALLAWPLVAWRGSDGRADLAASGSSGGAERHSAGLAE